MNDTLIFEGKNYISARRASEISDYSSDYIGQLCRAKKLDCRMVGRSWYLTQASLEHHRQAVMQDEIHRNRLFNLRAGRRPQHSFVNERLLAAEDATVEYMPDDRPLMPAISKLHRSIEEGAVEGGTSALQFAKDAVAVTLFAACVLGMAAVAGRFENFAAVRLESASVFEMSESARSVFGRGSGESGRIVTLGPIASAESAPVVRPVLGASSSEMNGLIVMPATGASASDVELKRNIAESFSDEVDVRPDQSGTSGVITPIFKQARGKDYIYVMVPVK